MFGHMKFLLFLLLFSSFPVPLHLSSFCPQSLFPWYHNRLLVGLLASRLWFIPHMAVTLNLPKANSNYIFLPKISMAPQYLLDKLTNHLTFAIYYKPCPPKKWNTHMFSYMPCVFPMPCLCSHCSFHAFCPLLDILCIFTGTLRYNLFYDTCLLSSARCNQLLPPIYSLKSTDSSLGQFMTFHSVVYLCMHKFYLLCQSVKLI